MCGIWGVVMTPESKAREGMSPNEMAHLMFPAIRHRGPHAFGWMSFDGDESVEVVKCDGDVALNRNLRHVTVRDDAMWVVGHVRYATHGSTEELSNNHPIIHGEVIGVHNGVLRNHEQILDQTGREEDITEVDSEAIFAAVNKWGHRAGLRRIQGDMVTVYTKTSKPENLWIARSRGRQLFLARTVAGSLVFASELGVLEAVFGGANLTHIRELRYNQLLRIRDGKVVEQDTFKIPAPQKAAVLPHAGLRKPGQLALGPGDPDQPQGVIARKAYDGIRGITDIMSKPTKPKGDSRPEVTKPVTFRDVGVNGKEAAPGLYWYQGQLLTEQEYVDVMQGDMR